MSNIVDVTVNCPKHGMQSAVVKCIVCTSKNMEVQPTSLQQLRAEILPLLERAYIALNKDFLTESRGYIEQVVAKLSAI